MTISTRTGVMTERCKKMIPLVLVKAMTTATTIGTECDTESVTGTTIRITLLCTSRGRTILGTTHGTMDITTATISTIHGFAEHPSSVVHTGIIRTGRDFTAGFIPPLDIIVPHTTLLVAMLSSTEQEAHAIPEIGVAADPLEVAEVAVDREDTPLEPAEAFTRPLQVGRLEEAEMVE